MNSPKLPNLTLVEMAKGLVNDQFLYYFQPIISLETGYIAGAECLLRWKEPSGAIRLPTDFIGLAESSGLIVDIERELIGRLGPQLSQLSQVDEHFYLTLNVAQSSLENSEFPDLLLDNLETHGLNKDLLRLEITERIFYPGTDVTSATIAQLSQMGFKLLLDDFGVGNSSVEYISQLPLVALKLGHELVDRGSHDATEFKIVRHLIGLGHQINLAIVAEGVEDPETLMLLASKGCTDVQGYYLARPMPFEQLLDMVGQHKRMWDGYPFGADYLAQIDHIDVRRDLIREVLILLKAKNKQARDRSLARMPDLDPNKCHFGRWYRQSSRLRSSNEELYQELGRRHEAFHDTCQRLLETALYNPDMEAIKEVIDQMSDESIEVMSLAQKISTDALLDHFAGDRSDVVPS